MISNLWPDEVDKIVDLCMNPSSSKNLKINKSDKIDFIIDIDEYVLFFRAKDLIIINEICMDLEFHKEISEARIVEAPVEYIIENEKLKEFFGIEE